MTRLVISIKVNESISISNACESISVVSLLNFLQTSIVNIVIKQRDKFSANYISNLSKRIIKCRDDLNGINQIVSDIEFGAAEAMEI